MKKWILLSMFLALMSGFIGSARGEDMYYIRVFPDDYKAALKTFSARHYDIAGIDRRGLTIDLVVPEKEFNLLEMEYFVEILKYPWEELRLDPEYKEPAEIEAIMAQFHADYPSITHLESIGQSFEGRDIWAMKISDNPEVDEDEPVVLYNGQHHAREVMACEVPLDTIEYLCSNYGADPQVTHWVDTLEIWVIPQLNVDGVNYVFNSYNMWRKDRHEPPPGSSDYGIDPNRNYPTFWGSCGGSSGDPGSETYRGQYAGESNCVSNMMNFVESIRPVFNISYHSYSELVIYPYGCDGDVTPEQDAVAAIGQEMAGLIEKDNGSMGYTPGTAWELLYAVDGGDVDWHYAEVGVFSYVIELNSSSQGFQPSWSWRDNTCQRLRPGWQYLLNRIEGPGITGHVLDACTGDPVTATVNIQELPLTADETPRMTDNYGRYFRVLLPGDYHLVVTADGYPDVTIPFTVSNQRLDYDVMMVPEGSYGLYIVNHNVLDADGDNDGVIDPGETVGIELFLQSVGFTTNVSATLTCSDPYVTIVTDTAQFGDIPDGFIGGSQAPHFVLTVDSSCPAQHEIELNFSMSADQDLCADSGSITKTVTNFVYECPLYEENLDSDPGYDIQNNNSGGWAFGTPSSGPGSAHTGNYCYGTNLNGDYSNYGDYNLTSTPFDCSAVTNTELRFWRWLYNESGYDTAYVQVSTDGASWTTVWSGYAQDTEWQEMTYDISGIADGEPMVYVRWKLTSDSYVTEPGFYIDDISICGDTYPPDIPNLSYYSHEIHDDAGNNDGEINAGETFGLALSLFNNGTDAQGVYAILSSENPHVTITSDTANFPDISQNTAETSLTDYEITISPEAANNEMLLFNIEWHTSESSGTASFTDYVVAPTLTFDACTVLDGNRGDGDGIIDPGEDVQLMVSLMNTGSGQAHNITATLSVDHPEYVTITDDSAEFPDISSGDSASCLPPYFSVTASEDTPDHTMVTFTLDIAADGYVTSDTFQMEITTSNFARRYFWSLDSDPGWTTEGQWEWGVPAGNNGDPTSGFTGENVYGYNLNGAYENNLPETNLTSYPIDCTYFENVEVRFMRWLGVESSSYDHASFEVSSDGTTWHTIWEHSGSSFTDNEWMPMSYDISQYADGEPTVYLRWVMGSTDSSVTYCGWNIDDIEIWAETSNVPPTATPNPPTATPTVTPTLPPTATPTPFECINDGDVDNNSSLTPQDALMAFQIYLGIIPDPTAEEYCSADCNGSDTVTPEDALCIFRHYLSGECDCVDPVSRAGNGAGVLSRAGRAGHDGIRASIGGSIQLAVTRNRNGDVEARVLTDADLSDNAFGFQLKFPRNLDFDSAAPGPDVENWLFFDAAATDGVVTVGAFDPSSGTVNDSGWKTLAVLTFSCHDDPTRAGGQDAWQVVNTVDALGNLPVRILAR